VSEPEETPAEEPPAEEPPAEEPPAEEPPAEETSPESPPPAPSTVDKGASATADEGWEPDPEAEPAAEAPPAAQALDEHEQGPPARPAIRGFLAEHLVRVGAVTARLGLAEAERSHEHLAETALWLALANLDLELGPVLDRWLEGRAWEHLFPGANPESPLGKLQVPSLQRLALGLALLDAARRPGTPASARALAALAAVALGCADPPTGRRLQPAAAELGLLPLTEQVPVALPIRQLVLEFRHLDLRQDPGPAFVARVEDLLDRLDRTELLGVRLQDHPAVVPDPAQAWWTALVGSRSPSLILLARLTLAEGIQDEEELLDALAERDSSWTEEGAEARLQALRATLAERLANTPLSGS
jgi:hypothetical protein